MRATESFGRWGEGELRRRVCVAGMGQAFVYGARKGGWGRAMDGKAVYEVWSLNKNENGLKLSYVSTNAMIPRMGIFTFTVTVCCFRSRCAL